MEHILIVGANAGIGYFMVKQLLEDGKSVSVLDIKTDNISKLQEQYPDTVFPVYADAADDTSVTEGVCAAIAHFGTPDAAIHNACMCTFDGALETQMDIYEKVMNVNYYGALRLAKAVLPPMREARKGRLIFTSSGVGVTGFGNISPYASSKGAIESLAKCLSVENEAFGISVHLFHPPLTNTESARAFPIPKEFKADPEKVGRGLGKKVFSKSFVICHSFSQSMQMKLCYLKPLGTGKMMWKMTQRAQNMSSDK